MKRRIFISWSGKRSQRVALSLRDWLPDVIQNAVPFVSEEDIAKGQRGNDVIAGELRESSIGIICLTPENVSAPWILFEAGALSNSLERKEMVCPYLLGLEKRDVQLPLAQFQLTSADEADTRRLVHAINGSFEGDYRSPPHDLDRRFEKWWPDLEVLLNDVRAAEPGQEIAPPRRSQENILAEVLETVRQISRRLSPPAWIQRELMEDWETEIDDSEEGNGYPFLAGDRVTHPQFGDGSVVSLTGSGLGVRAIIDFDKVGRKKIVVRYANLQRLAE